MSENIWRDGDKITINKSRQGWQVEVLRGKKDDGSTGGIVGQLGNVHATPEDALSWLRKTLTGG